MSSLNKYKIISSIEVLLLQLSFYNNNEYLNDKTPIIKKTITVLRFDYLQLGEALNLSSSILKKNSTNDDLVSMSQLRTIELYLENLLLKKELSKTNEFRKSLNIFLKG